MRTGRSFIVPLAICSLISFSDKHGGVYAANEQLRRTNTTNTNKVEASSSPSSSAVSDRSAMKKRYEAALERSQKMIVDHKTGRNKLDDKTYSSLKKQISLHQKALADIDSQESIVKKKHIAELKRSQDKLADHEAGIGYPLDKDSLESIRKKIAHHEKHLGRMETEFAREMVIKRHEKRKEDVEKRLNEAHRKIADHKQGTNTFEKKEYALLKKQVTKLQSHFDHLSKPLSEKVSIFLYMQNMH